MNYKTIEELFHCSENRSRQTKFEIYVSMLEVYSDDMRDLLVDARNKPAKKLEVKSSEGTQEVPELVEEQVFNTGQVWSLLKRGYGVRSVGSTAKNKKSSRSHCLLQVTAKGEPEAIDGHRTKSHIWLMDLAGSE
ncbi:unnamed protein product [Cochlearia groenlandica]